MSPEKTLKNRVAIVTGASQGLGKATARAFAEAGANVMAVSRDANKLAQTVKEVEALGSKAAACAVDLTRAGAADQVLGQTLQHFSAIDFVVNAAGVFIWKEFLDLTEEDWEKTLNTNLKVPFLLTSTVSRYLIQNKKPGSIINITSVHGSIGDAKVIPHCASKFGLEGMTKAFAEALRPYNIRINTIAPGAIESNSAERFSGSLQEKVTQRDIAHLAVYLASDATRFMTGATLDAYGGTRVTIK